ncbi:MAG: hypothetical protein V4864_00740 [Pseudomonadota bacterium]
MRQLFAFLAACAAAGLVHAQADPAPITYQGVAIGAAQDAFQSRLPDFQCQGSACIYDLTVCAGMGDARAFNAARMNGCMERTAIAGAYVTRAWAQFKNGRLARIAFTLPSDQAEKLMATVTERHGKPDTLDETPIRTQSGASFPNRRASWDVAGTSLTTVQRSLERDSGAATLAGSTKGW